MKRNIVFPPKNVFPTQLTQQTRIECDGNGYDYGVDSVRVVGPQLNERNLDEKGLSSSPEQDF